MLDTLKATWKGWLLILIGAALLVAPLLAGQCQRPTPSTPQVDLKETVKTDLKADQKVARSEAKKVNKVIDRTTLPDGTKKEHIEVKAASSKRTDVDTKVDLKQDVKFDLKVTPSPPRKDWKASLLVGVKPLKLEPVVGLQVERRVLGDFSVGAWVMNPTRSIDPTVGLSLSYTW